MTNLIDLSYLKENISDDPDFISEILNMFKLSNMEEMEKLEEAARTQSFDELKKVSHKLKSSFRSLGINHTTNLLEEMETLARQQDGTDRIAQTMAAIQSDYQIVLREIDHVLSSQ